MMAHFAIRGLMHEAALKADKDPDRLSFPHAVRVIRRKLPAFLAIPPQHTLAFHDTVLDEILQECLQPRGHRRNRRAVKRKMSNFPRRRRTDKPLPSVDIRKAIRVLKWTVLSLARRHRRLALWMIESGSIDHASVRVGEKTHTYD
jgi:hypothetical protein